MPTRIWVETGLRLQCCERDVAASLGAILASEAEVLHEHQAGAPPIPALRRPAGGRRRPGSGDA